MKKICAVFLMVSLALFWSSIGSATERDDLGWYTLVERESERVVTMTARILEPGDSYIAWDNRRFEVTEIEGDTVHVTYTETIELPEITDDVLRTQTGGTAQNKEMVVGIYHTHNDESYVPSSGTESKEDGRGDILEVGKILADTMEKAGLKVIWSDNSHLPHDGQAYARSRRTVAELLQYQPVTLIDVHRDATPPEVYSTEIQGQPATKVRIVVGRQNQNRAANLEYAKRIKAVADKFFPGIIEGIFDARGNYNQDLGSRMILLEFGAHTNYLEHASQAAEFFAKVIPAAAGLTSEEAGPAQQQIGGAAGRSVYWMLGIVAAGIVGFVLLNKEGLGSLKDFFRREAGLPVENDDPQQENDS